MSTVNMLEAKTHLSRLVEALELGRETEIVIARNGRPVARLVPMAQPSVTQRIGVAKGCFSIPDGIDELDPEIEALFHGSTS